MASRLQVFIISCLLLIRAPHSDLDSKVIDGTGREATLRDLGGIDVVNAGKSQVTVYTVSWLILSMAAATGLSAVPFFFFKLEPQWAGICNGLAAGVMLAASFDLVQDGQSYGSSGSYVVIGIMSGAIFIWLCKKVMRYSQRKHFPFILSYVSWRIITLQRQG